MLQIILGSNKKLHKHGHMSEGILRIPIFNENLY